MECQPRGSLCKWTYLAKRQCYGRGGGENAESRSAASGRLRKYKVGGKKTEKDPTRVKRLD